MRTYLLITGTWLAAAAATAYVYVRVAGFAAGSDAHFFQPRPGARRSRPASFALPGWFLAPLAVGCVAAALMADFALTHEPPPSPAHPPVQSVRMAEPGKEVDRAPSVEVGPRARPPFESSGRATPMRLPVTA